ncbi:MAG: hypothetical protein ACRD3Q_07320 [Terriglobales bacterium]
MRKRAGAGGEQSNADTVGTQQPDSSDGELTLLGDAGREVAENVARIALGKLTVGELKDSRYRLARDGTLMLSIDGESYDAVQKIVGR